MRPHVLLAVVALVLVPIAASAQTAPPPPDTRPDAKWSFGAGVSYAIYAPLTGVMALPGEAQEQTVPVVNASLERRLSARTWLVAGAIGAADRSRADVSPSSFGYTSYDARTLYLTGGIRRILTGAGAPVDVSILALAEAGVGDADRTLSSLGTETRQQATTWIAGTSVGIAIDRELTGALSLRVASQLVGAWYTWARVEEAGEPGRKSNAFSVEALLSPRLELRLAF